MFQIETDCDDASKLESKVKRDSQRPPDHDAQHPSYLLLPVVESASSGRADGR